MSWNPDLSPRWIYAKAALFVGILALSSALVIIEPRAAVRALVLPLIIWSAARFYYFMFYVIERYVDPTYRFAGVWDCLQFLVRKAINRTCRPSSPTSNAEHR